ATGQDLLQCIAPDVREGLLFVTPADALPPVTPDVPAEIAALRVPAAFALIGSADRGFSIAAAYKASGDPQAVLDAAVSALTADGWALAPGANMPSAFASPTMTRSQSLCKDGNSAGVSVRLVDDTTYVSYSVAKSSERTDCAMRGTLRERMDAGLPSFDYSAFGAPTPRGSSGSSSGISTLRSTRVDVNAELPALASELARQLREQGWQEDTSWTGTVTAGSTWSRTTDGARRAGTL